MNPARIENHTFKLSPPMDWDAQANGHCGTLYVRAEVLDGVNFMRSAWDVEALEALKLAAGSRLVLGIAGHVHPVVHLSHTELPEDFEPVMICRRVINDQQRPAVRVDAAYPCPPNGMHVHAVVEMEAMSFEVAAMIAMKHARELAEDIQSGKKEL